MNATPNALAPHSGGSLLPYVIVGFGDDTWGIMDGRTGHYALFGDQLRLFSRASLAKQAASRYVGPDAIHVEGPGAFNFWFGPYLGTDGQPPEAQHPVSTHLYQVPVRGQSFNGASGGMAVVRAATPVAAVALVRAEGLFYDGEDRSRLGDVLQIEDTGKPGIVAQYTWAE